MTGRSTVQAWLRETRANFLVLPVVLVCIGGAAAFRSAGTDYTLFALTLAGVILAHISVNLLNEYSDWKTGIDDHTMKTPFSGGSGMMQAGLITPSKVRVAAWGTLIAAFSIGLFLTWKAGWPVFALMVAGGLTSFLYTEHLARWTLGEAMSGLTLGTFVVLGAYFVQAGSFDTAIVWASVPPGILTAELLFLNEFPDADADRRGGRRHLVIVLGPRRAAFLYTFLMLSVYCIIVLGTIFGHTPRGTLIALLTLPVAGATIRGALIHNTDPAHIVPALGLNVVTVLGTDALIAIGFLIG